MIESFPVINFSSKVSVPLRADGSSGGIFYWADTIWDTANCFALILLIPALIVLIVILAGVLTALVLLFRRTPRQVNKSGPLRLERCSSGRRKLLQDFTVTIGEGEGAIPVLVKKGFETDYSSIPFVFQWAMRWWKVDVAGVVHDWLYANAKDLKQCGKMTLGEADRIWWDIALSGERHAHANYWQAAVGWLGIKVGGWVTWNRYKRNAPDHLLPRREDRLMQMDTDLMGKLVAYETILGILLANLSDADFQKIRNPDPWGLNEQQLRQLGVWAEHLPEVRRLSLEHLQVIFEAAARRRDQISE